MPATKIYTRLLWVELRHWALEVDCSLLEATLTKASKYVDFPIYFGLFHYFSIDIYGAKTVEDFFVCFGLHVFSRRVC